jgi:hypothetical protein
MPSKKRERIRGKHKRSERIAELSEELFEQHYDEDSAPADLGDVIELICLMADQLKELSSKESEK